ncbi:hypothetical protein D5086_017424 [Populus alba]|uniref:Uncharacterized protein n=1 Tax=Populus alba TaxID=43335 RepID=A0ACC4BXD6_POPAL
MAAKAAVVIEESVGRSVCKQAKLASQPRSPDAFSGSPQVVHVSEYRFDATTVTGALSSTACGLSIFLLVQLPPAWLKLVFL